MKTLLLISLCCLPLTTLAAEVRADTTTSDANALVVRAVQDGRTGVALSNLALRKSASPQVQEFARRMVDIQNETTAGLAEFARARGIETPADLDSTRAALVLAVDTEEGAAFDHVYAKHMKSEQAKVIELFEEAARSPDAELAQFARKTLPALKTQYASARKLARAAR